MLQNVICSEIPVCKLKQKKVNNYFWIYGYVIVFQIIENENVTGKLENFIHVVLQKSSILI